MIPRDNVGSEAFSRAIFVPYVHAYGGVERLILSLSAYLHGQDIPHHLVCFKDTLGLANRSRFPLRVVQLRPSRNPAHETYALHHYFRTHAIRDPLLFGLKSALYARLACLPRYYLHLEDPPSLLPLDVSKHAWSARWYFACGGISPLKRMRGEAVHRINGQGIRRAARTIVMTDAIRQEVTALYGVTPIVMRPGIERVAATKSTSEERYRLLSVSRLSPNKRIDWVLRALADPEIPRAWKLDIVGEGEDRDRLQALVTTLSLESRVQFHGHVNDEVLDSLYLQASIFVMPSIQGYGLPALEALDRALPVVMSEASGVSEILGNTTWVILHHDSADAFKRALISMIERLDEDQFGPAPVVPSEADWARSITEVCGWT